MQGSIDSLTWKYSRTERRHTGYDSAGEERFWIVSRAPAGAAQGKHLYGLKLAEKLHKFLAFDRSVRKLKEDAERLAARPPDQVASLDEASPLHPRVGELWDCLGCKAFVAGNCVDDDGTIWLLDWDSGAVGYLSVITMTVRADRKTLTEDEIVQRMTEWARQGNADAMWWIAWWYEGKNHPKSVWYYVAAMRADPKKHGWAHERVYDDARSAYTCKGVPAPDLGFLEAIPEMRGERIGRDWEEAVREAEKAVHLQAAVQAKSRVYVKENFAPGSAPAATDQ